MQSITKISQFYKISKVKLILHILRKTEALKLKKTSPKRKKKKMRILIRQWQSTCASFWVELWIKRKDLSCMEERFLCLDYTFILWIILEIKHVLVEYKCYRRLIFHSLERVSWNILYRPFWGKTEKYSTGLICHSTKVLCINSTEKNTY